MRKARAITTGNNVIGRNTARPRITSTHVTTRNTATAATEATISACVPGMVFCKRLGASRAPITSAAHRAACKPMSKNLDSDGVAAGGAVGPELAGCPSDCKRRVRRAVRRPEWTEEYSPEASISKAKRTELELRPRAEEAREGVGRRTPARLVAPLPDGLDRPGDGKDAPRNHGRQRHRKVVPERLRVPEHVGGKAAKIVLKDEESAEIAGCGVAPQHTTAEPPRETTALRESITSWRFGEVGAPTGKRR